MNEYPPPAPGFKRIARPRHPPYTGRLTLPKLPETMSQNPPAPSRRKAPPRRRRAAFQAKSKASLPRHQLAPAHKEVFLRELLELVRASTEGACFLVALTR